MASPGSLTARIVAEGGTVTQGFLVPIDNIHIEPGFNLRIPGPDLDAHIRWLADQIKRVGFDSTQPLAVIRHPELDGHVIIRKGHCRYDGAVLARKEGREIVALPCLPEPRGSNEIIQTYQLGTSNSGLGLNYLEYAAAVMRQRGYGQSDDQIVEGFGKNKEWLNRVLDLSEAPVAVRDLVAQGKVTQTDALNVHKRQKSNAPVVLRAAVEHAQARGKTKATGQDIKAVERPDPPRTEPTSLCSLAVAAVLGDRTGASADLVRRLEALEVHIGPPTIEAAREKLAA